MSLFFLDPEAREDAALKADLAQGMGKPNRGVLHAENTEDQRGGFSLFVPEDTRDDTPRPRVVALRGGSGHGRSVLWHGGRTARTRGGNARVGGVRECGDRQPCHHGPGHR